MAHQSILAYARYRYLKLATVARVAVVAVYAWDRPPNGRYGGTWLGYTLGTIGALMILWLSWFGVRKRNYSSTAGMLQGWLSAHVYFGTVLIVIATLHMAFKVGWNVHTLAYVLMLAVIFSGFYGVYAYMRFPREMTDNLGDDTLALLLIKITDLDREARQLTLSLPDSISKLVLESAQGTQIGGSWVQQLRGRDSYCPTTAGRTRRRRRTAAPRSRRPMRDPSARSTGGALPCGDLQAGRRHLRSCTRSRAIRQQASRT